MEPVELFYNMDEFCKAYNREVTRYYFPLLRCGGPIRTMNDSEILTIRILYHYSGYKTMKDFYTNEQERLRYYFPRLVSYSRLVELCEEYALQLMICAKVFCTVASDDTNYIDSTKLEVCHIRRASSHKTFKGIATKGRTSVGWFFGFKLHLVTNMFGEIVNFDITPGNVADNNANLIRRITKKLIGKLFGDRGYLLNPQLYKELFERGLQVITRLRSNMKTRIFLFEDAMKLRKRGISESIIGILKQTLSLEHSRHRSFSALLAHIASTLIAYFFRPHKPSIVPKSRLLPA